MSKEVRGYNIKSLAEMGYLAEQLAGKLVGGESLLLRGTLGSGKTSFVQALGRALGVEDQITSPTFTIVGEYDVVRHPSIQKLIHVDLYRLSNQQVKNELAVSEVLRRANEGERLTVIEWSEKLGEHKMPQVIEISFVHGATANERLVTIEL